MKLWMDKYLFINQSTADNKEITISILAQLNKKIVKVQKLQIKDLKKC
jgi:hypothetical protein